MAAPGRNVLLLFICFRGASSGSGPKPIKKAAIQRLFSVYGVGSNFAQDHQGGIDDAGYPEQEREQKADPEMVGDFPFIQQYAEEGDEKGNDEVQQGVVVHFFLLQQRAFNLFLSRMAERGCRF